MRHGQVCGTHLGLFSVTGKYVKENALVVIRLLLRHSKCLDAIVNNRQGLSDLFRSAIFPDFRRDGSFSIDGSHSPTSQSRHSHSPDSSEDETESRKSSEFSTATPRSGSLFGRSWMSVISPSTMSMTSSGSLLMADSEGATLKFLADLLKLLGYCAPSLPDNLRFTSDQTRVTKKLTKQATRLNLRSPSPDEGSVGNLETSIARHTHSLLHDLIDHDDILEVLNIPLSIEYWDMFNPLHKEACLLFYDRVYGIQDSEQLHQFISSVSLPDVKFTISMATAEVQHLCITCTCTAMIVYIQYICAFILYTRTHSYCLCVCFAIFTVPTYIRMEDAYIYVVHKPAV